MIEMQQSVYSTDVQGHKIPHHSCTVVVIQGNWKRLRSGISTSLHHDQDSWGILKGDDDDEKFHGADISPEISPMQEGRHVLGWDVVHVCFKTKIAIIRQENHVTLKSDRLIWIFTTQWVMWIFILQRKWALMSFWDRLNFQPHISLPELKKTVLRNFPLKLLTKTQKMKTVIGLE